MEGALRWPDNLQLGSTDLPSKSVLAPSFWLFWGVGAAHGVGGELEP